jgi:hypothetical protein
MASLLSSAGDLQLNVRLLRTSFDPFQQDLEWFEYEVSVEAGLADDTTETAAQPAIRTAVRGNFNRQEFNQLLRALDDLLDRSCAMRFEPSDLKFYFEWSHETPSVFLLVTWFDLALSARTLQQRFPAAHGGYRFLAGIESLRAFRHQVEAEFTRPSAAAGRLV